MALSPSIMVEAEPAPLGVRSTVRARIETGQGWWTDAWREGWGEPAHPRRPCRFHHPRPDKKRVAGLQQAPERLEGGHGPQRHHEVLLVALPRTAVKDLDVEVGQASGRSRLIVLTHLHWRALGSLAGVGRHARRRAIAQSRSFLNIPSKASKARFVSRRAPDRSPRGLIAPPETGNADGISKRDRPCACKSTGRQVLTMLSDHRTGNCPHRRPCDHPPPGRRRPGPFCSPGDGRCPALETRRTCPATAVPLPFQ